MIPCRMGCKVLIPYAALGPPSVWAPVSVDKPVVVVLVVVAHGVAQPSYWAAVCVTGWVCSAHLEGVGGVDDVGQAIATVDYSFAGNTYEPPRQSRRLVGMSQTSMADSAI